MKALVGAFNQEKALVGAFSVIVKTCCGTDGALHSTTRELRYVHLTVSTRQYRHQKMFGTRISSNKRRVKDVCSGDSGINNSYDIFGLCNNTFRGTPGVL